MASSQKTLIPGFSMEKNPAVCLVYNVTGTGRTSLTRTKASQTILPKASAAGAAKPATLAKLKPLKLCADGDSWVNILWPLSSGLGHEMTFYDVIQQKYQTAIDVAFPGDTFQQMRAAKDYRQPIGAGTIDFFIFSGGGNDVLGGGALVNLLRWRDEGNGSSDPEKYIFLDLLDDTIKRLREGYIEIAKDVKAKSHPKNTLMLVHGYDYPKPRAGGVWIGKPFASRGYNLTADKDLIAAIIRLLVDRFYEMLHDVISKTSNVIVIDLRGTVRNRWNDELHPKTAASKDIAAKFIRVFDPAPFA